MARYLAATATGPGGGDSFFTQLRDHLVANGWTQHDIISSTPGSRDVVFRGAALDATADIRPFLRLTQTSTTVIVALCYADWDTSTHAGIAQAGVLGTSNWVMQDATFSFYVWVDGYGGWWLAKQGANTHRAHFGFARRGLPAAEAGITKATGALTAGATSIAVASDMTGKLRVGQKVLVMNYAHSSGSANAAHCELVTISSVASGSIGVSALAQNYDAGAVIGENICPMGVSQSNTSLGGLGGTTYCPYNADGSRTGNTGQQGTHEIVVFGTETSVDPGDISQKFAPGVVGFNYSTASKLDWRGYPRGVVAAAGGVQVLEDLMDDGTYTYLVAGTNAAGVYCMGPREL